jgi:carbamoyltransferase
VLSTSPFSALHVPAAPADDGNAVGAALLAFNEDHPEHRRAPERQSPFLGSRMSRGTLRLAAESGAFRHVEVLPPEPMASRLAAALDRGRLVGLAQGRAEFGPRALGQRSILADPRRAEMKDRINAAVKFREAYRPFAPSVLQDRAHEYFVDAQESPYMERTLRFREAMVDRVPAVVHADGTGRLQTIRSDWSPMLHAVVSAFDRRTSVPMVVNTSFNVMGKPIVHSVEDALSVFATSGLDVVAIEDHLFTKSAETR